MRQGAALIFCGGGAGIVRLQRQAAASRAGIFRRYVVAGAACPAQVNENNSKMPTLWARERFEATIVDRPKNKAMRIDGYGNVLFTAPNQMKLTAKNEVVELFEMGSDGRRFWL